VREDRRPFGMVDAILTVVTVLLLIVVAMFATAGCTIHDGYVRPAVAISGGYYSPGYGGVSVEVGVPSVYPGYGYGYDPYDYPGYRRYYSPRPVECMGPRAVYRRLYYPPSVVFRTRVVHHHHHPAYRRREVAAPERQWRHPVRPPAYRRPVAVAQRNQRYAPPRRNQRVRRR